jgi:DNA (cytosine-5)-methyltransferase 1
MSEKIIKILDLFAGGGGFGLGFNMASPSYSLICSLEVDDWAVETLRANNSNSQHIIHDDIRHFASEDQIRRICPNVPDIIIGGPPCQGFSVAGPMKDPKDPRNSLFKNFAQWVDILRPAIFIMENVKGLLKRKNEKGERVIEIIQRTFESIGYTTTIWNLNAANYGVPQNRERIFIVGNLSGDKILPPAITHFLPYDKQRKRDGLKFCKPAISVIKAIGDLPRLKAGEGEEVAEYKYKPRNYYQKEIRGKSETLFNHVSMNHTKRIIERYEKILNGFSLQQLPLEYQVRKRNGNGEISTTEYNSNYRHLKPDMISYTIPASFYSNFIHPNQPRNITSREAARLQSFPDSYIFKGKRTQISSKLLKQLGKSHENFLSQYNQIGNAVPPLLSKAIAIKILDFFHKQEQQKT